jgi:glutamine phosphoribosylpyrophosphate amidotransferase
MLTLMVAASVCLAACVFLQARVLAARDHSGAVPLMEGRTAAGSLIIACGTFLPEGVTCMSDIKPGAPAAAAAALLVSLAFCLLDRVVQQLC